MGIRKERTIRHRGARKGHVLRQVWRQTVAADVTVPREMTNAQAAGAAQALSRVKEWTASAYRTVLLRSKYRAGGRPFGTQELTYCYRTRTKRDGADKTEKETAPASPTGQALIPEGRLRRGLPVQ